MRFERTAHSASEDELAVLESFGPFVGNRSESARTPVQMYERRLRRLIISLLHASGIRRGRPCAFAEKEIKCGKFR